MSWENVGNALVGFADGFNDPSSAARSIREKKRMREAAALEAQRMDKAAELEQKGYEAKLATEQKYKDLSSAKADRDELEALITTAIEHPREATEGVTVPGLTGDISFPGLKEPAYTTAKFQQAARKSLPAVSASGDVAQAAGAYPMRKQMGRSFAGADIAGADYRKAIATSGMEELPSRTQANIAQNNQTIAISPFTTAQTIAQAVAGTRKAEMDKDLTDNLNRYQYPNKEALRMSTTADELGQASKARIDAGLPTSDAKTAAAKNDLIAAKAQEEGFGVRTKEQVQEDVANARALEQKLQKAGMAKAEMEQLTNLVRGGTLRKAIVTDKNGNQTIDLSKVSEQEAELIQTIMGIMRASPAEQLLMTEYMKQMMKKKKGESAGGPVAGYGQGSDRPTTATPVGNKLGSEE